MRVTTRLELDWHGNILSQDAYDYEGPIALAKGPDVPQPSAEERALQSEQTALLREQRDILSRQVREQQLLAPFLFEDTGVKPIFDEETGEITAFEEIPDPLDPLRQDIEKGFLERTQAALAGELPVNPALMSDLEKEEALLNEQLRKNLGPGYQTSTPGIQALSEFQEKKVNILDAARRGDLTLSEQLSLARSGSQEAGIDQNLMRLLGITGRSDPSVAGALGVAGGLGNVAAGMQSERLNKFAIQQQAESSTLSSLFGAAGAIGGGISTGLLIRQ